MPTLLLGHVETMPWRLTDDAQRYARQARPLLEARPVENTLALMVLDHALAPSRSATARSPIADRKVVRFHR